MISIDYLVCRPHISSVKLPFHLVSNQFYSIFLTYQNFAACHNYTIKNHFLVSVAHWCARFCHELHPRWTFGCIFPRCKLGVARFAKSIVKSSKCVLESIKENAPKKEEQLQLEQSQKTQKISTAAWDTILLQMVITQKQNQSGNCFLVVKQIHTVSNCYEI